MRGYGTNALECLDPLFPSIHFKYILTKSSPLISQLTQDDSFRRLVFISLGGGFGGAPHDKSALEKKATSNVIELDFDIEGGQHHGVVLFGSEGVSYKPIIDSGSWETWFANDNDMTDYSTTLVNLTTPFSINYVGSGNPATGIFIKDTIKFTNAKSDGFEFGILNNPPWFPQGILAIARLQGSDHDTLTYHLKMMGQVERTVSSLYYSKLQNKG